MRIGTQELMIILLIVIVIFGPTQLPKLTKMFGKSMKSFKQGISEDTHEESAAKAENQKTARDAESDK